MDALDVSRWQFGITTVYHFILVPLTIGLAPLIAIMQTMWVITKKDHWYRLTKFFGKFFLINFALGVATGIVQEFQFGMNWSEYSRFVGDVFGAPLALEGLVAFFLESTFLGLWIFGWGRLPKLVHLATIWLVAIGVNASAFFIIAANSFMQHPVGARVQRGARSCRAHQHLGTAHQQHGAGGLPARGGGRVPHRGHLRRRHRRLVDGAQHAQGQGGHGPGGRGRRTRTPARTMFRPVTILALWVMVASGVGLAITGDIQAKLMFEQQPMKMASAESLCHTETGADFSILTVGTQNNCENITQLISIPGLTSFLANGDPDSTLQGVTELQAQYEEQFGPGNYKPNLFVTYWTFRAMIGWAAGLGAPRRGRAVDDPRRPGAGQEVVRLAVPCSPSPRRSSATAPAGCSPRWAASPGWCTRIRPGWTRSG